MQKYLIGLLVALSFAASSSFAAIVVDGTSIIRTLPDAIGGIMLNPYADTTQTAQQGFTNNTAYQAAFNQAAPAIARLTTYPDYHKTSTTGGATPDSNPTSIMVNYDPKIDLLRANGATPLFVVYTAPNNTTSNSNIMMNYYVNLSGKNKAHDGVTDGTLATNVVYLVKHYLGLDGGHYAANPINLQYWEIGNEPDGSVNGKYYFQGQSGYSYIDYCNQFNSVDALLRATSDGQGGNLRSHVVLCGPALSVPYQGSTAPIATFYNYFLQNCAATGACDIVTYHFYSNSHSGDTLSYLLTSRVEKFFNAAANYVSGLGVGEGGLQRAMASYNVPANVGTGVTEFNTLTDGAVGYRPHSIQQGLWTALGHHYMMYNYHSLYGSAPGGTILTPPVQLQYQNKLSTGFIFDLINNSNFAYFTTQPSGITPWTYGDYNYWASYIANRLTGPTLLAQSYTTSLSSGTIPLICTASQDSQYLYIQIINRSYDSTGNTPQAVTETVNLNNVGSVGAGTVYTLSAVTNNLPPMGDSSVTQTGGLNPSFSYTFPAESITVFRFPRGPVGYYRCEQNASDGSGYNNNGSVTSGFTYSTNATEGAYSGAANGSTGCLYVPDSASLRITGNLTVATWVNASSLGSVQNLVAKSFNTGYRLRLNASGYPNLILGKDSAGNVVQATGTQAVTAGTWAHVAATVTFSAGTATFRFYVNGVPDATAQTATLSSIYPGTGNLVIGGRSYPGNTGEWFNGLIDRVKIYNRALGDTEVADEAADGFDFYQGLVGHYRYEQNANDGSGLGNNGSVTSGFTYSTNATEGAYSGAANGSTGCLYVPDSASLRITGNLTIATWVNASSLGSVQNLVAKSFNTGYRLRLNASGYPNLILGKDSASNVVQATGTQAVTAGTWAHVAATVTFSAGTATFRFYVNGVPDATAQTATLSSIYPGTGNLVIGGRSYPGNTGEWFNGLIEKTTIYNRALSDVEIVHLTW